LGVGRYHLLTSPGWVERPGRASGQLDAAGHLGASSGLYPPPSYDRTLTLTWPLTSSSLARSLLEELGDAFEELGGVGDHFVEHPVAGEE